MSYLKVKTLVNKKQEALFDYFLNLTHWSYLTNSFLKVQSSRDLKIQLGGRYCFDIEFLNLNHVFEVEVIDLKHQDLITYRQIQGPLQDWIHTVRFEKHNEETTLLTDYIDYKNKFGLIGALADDFLTRRLIEFLINKKNQRLKKN